MKIPFLDLRINDKNQRKELLTAINDVFIHGQIILGPEVLELEHWFAAQCKRKYAVGVNSGTDALYLGLKAAGIGKGDEVITTALSWIATANAIALTQATPVFADIGDDLNIDPESVKELITPRTKAVVPVHYTGKVCKMDALMAIAEKHGLMVIEDAAQAFGAEYCKGRAGSFGLVACFSMNAMKIFAACGEAGMVVTDRLDIRDKLMALRYNGVVNKEDCIEVSLNARLDTLQAAILLKRIKGISRIIESRREIALWYNGQLSAVVGTPKESSKERDVYYTYTIRAEKRDALKRFLEIKGIETKIQHPYLMPEQRVFHNKGRGNFPNAKRLVKQILSIPAHEKLTQAQMDYVACSIKEFYNGTN